MKIDDGKRKVVFELEDCRNFIDDNQACVCLRYCNKKCEMHRWLTSKTLQETFYKMFEDDFSFKHSCEQKNFDFCPFISPKEPFINHYYYPWRHSKLIHVWRLLSPETKIKIHDHFCYKRKGKEIGNVHC
jgi:hypothetical protein